MLDVDELSSFKFIQPITEKNQIKRKLIQITRYDTSQKNTY